jgi:hypothetical protein
MTAPASIERMRRHREELQYALAHNLPLKVARDRMAEERWRARAHAVEALRDAGRGMPAPVPEAEPRRCFWWDRD